MHVGTVQGEKPAFVTDWLSYFPLLAQPHHTVASSFLPTEKVDPGPEAILWFFSFLLMCFITLIEYHKLKHHYILSIIMVYTSFTVMLTSVCIITLLRNVVYSFVF